MSLLDRHQRPMRNLRLSVTDRCNLRCSYCMPEEDYTWLARPELLSFEEIGRMVDIFASLGVDRIRLTGGEPLLRRELPVLIRAIASRPAIRDLALTTNGVLLEDQAASLHEAGLHRITVSLDTLRPDRFRALTRRGDHERVLAGIRSVGPAGFEGLKIDTVLTRGVNDDEMIDLLEYAATVDAELRFIEYMDVGGATKWSPERVVSRAEMLQVVGRRYGAVEPVVEPDSSAPADRYRLPDGRVFGIISSTTQPFCATCDRARLTADGHWYLCLYARLGTDLRQHVRGGKSDAEIAAIIEELWSARTDRGAEDRLRVEARGALAQKDELRRDPRLEMHTRGG
ncbi:MAG: GTP 3',8-cyclase MoaA [Planctomycetes bacterium]|nr:GTP 3',8-cyclase MoaA [Planctomycetota bacterium]